MTLDEYFEKHYGGFECECEWYVDPAPKSWKFYVPSLHVDIVLSENDGEVTELRFSKLPSDRAFRDVVVEELWDNLADVPIDPETEELDEPYYIWPKGTDKEDIWHWFDEHHSKGVAYLLGFAD